MNIRSDRRFRFDEAPATVWAALTQVECYQLWWPWLREFEGARFVGGERWECVVQPPLPYRLRLSITLLRIDEQKFVQAHVDGDITGSAELSLHAMPGGRACEVRLVSTLAPVSAMLRTVALLARPAAIFGHDWVLDTGARQFRSSAIEG